jgi:hypothetical protein
VRPSDAGRCRGFCRCRSRPLPGGAEPLATIGWRSTAFSIPTTAVGWRLGRERVGPELVRALMRDLGLVACQPRFAPTRIDSAVNTPDARAAASAVQFGAARVEGEVADLV